MVTRLMSELTARGIKLRPVPDGLRYEAPRGALTPELRAELAKHKAELLAMLAEPADAERLDIADCMALIAEAFRTVEAEYIEGALSMLDADPGLEQRFKATEEAIDVAVRAGPSEAQLRTALAEHVEVIAECCRRQRARQERAA
jgi:hypothetical protein